MAVQRTDLTVIYRTANHERPAFEARIQDTLRAAVGDTPLISVSQQPIPLGRNLCVGEVGRSNVNTWRQLQIGALAAETEFVCTAESDFLHAPDYFAFVPPKPDVLYVPDPIYVLFARARNRPLAWPKHGCQGAFVTTKAFLLACLERLLDGCPEWTTEMVRDLRAVGIFYQTAWETFPTEVPTVTFKTEASMHLRTGVGRPPTAVIPHWGAVADLLQAYRCNGEAAA